MTLTNGIIPVPNETNASATRLTKSGKKITYKMHVLQQPEKARACGSGAKSSADRRPVDPPPIVELRVFEGHNAEFDITMEYKANFFLFATLENARQLQHGRVQAPSVLPVLTGTPVAGMAHLERPHPAGYFIFPDLSVRHEGKYRLGFSLYEELKEMEDMDPEVADNPEKHKNPHVSHRLEVKSAPFTVYSAKRFPGLSESTTLSKVFAEQGCRVRIRRDVRIRRRGNEKPTEFDDEEYEARLRHSVTPDIHPSPDRLHHSQHHQQQCSRPSSSRLATEQMQHVYLGAGNGPVPSPTTPTGPYVQQKSWNPYGLPPPPPHAHFSAPQPYPSVQGQGQGSAMMPGMPPPPPPSLGYSHARTGSIDYTKPPVGPPPPRLAPPSNNNYAAPITQYASVAPVSAYPPHQYPQQQQQHQQQQQQQQLQQQQLQLQHKQQQQLPSPLSAIPPNHIEPPLTSPLTPISGKPDDAASYQSSYAPPPPPAGPAAAPSQPPQAVGSKRSYSSTFDTTSITQPLRHGQRPDNTSFNSNVSNETGNQLADVDESDAWGLSGMVYSYRRADGSQRKRDLPAFAVGFEWN